METRQIIVGSKAPANYVLAVAHVLESKATPKLVARGNNAGTAVRVACDVSRHNLAARPRLARLGQAVHPNSGNITTLEIAFGEGGDIKLPTKPTDKPVIVGQKDASAYALAIRARFQQGAKSVLVRARQEGPISKALTAANLAASLGFADQVELVQIGEEAAIGGALVPFVEITVTARQAA